MSLLTRPLTTMLICLLLAACGTGGSDDTEPAGDSGSLESTVNTGSDSPTPAPESTTTQSNEQAKTDGGADLIAVHGMGVKGPLADAVVSVYTIDTGKPGFRGVRVAEGVTDDNAQLLLDIDSRYAIEEYLMIEYTQGRELDGSPSILPTLRTAITARQLLEGTPVYATPMTTLVVDSAVQASRMDISMATFRSALRAADARVRDTFGLGLLNDDINLFTTSPVLSEHSPQTDSLAYRTAMEVLAARLQSIRLATLLAGAELKPAALIPVLAADLVDGEIDGARNGNALNGLAQLEPVQLRNIMQTSPTRYAIPGTNLPITQLNTVLVTEAEQVAPQVRAQALPAPEFADSTPPDSEPAAEQPTPEPDVATSEPPPETPATADPGTGDEPQVTDAGDSATPPPEQPAETPPPTPEPEPTPTPTAPQPTRYDVVLNWNTPTAREDGSGLLPGEIAYYEVYYYREGTAKGSGQVLHIPAVNNNGQRATSYSLQLSQSGRYYFAIACFDANDVSSQLSREVAVDVP